MKFVLMPPLLLRDIKSCEDLLIAVSEFVIRWFTLRSHHDVEHFILGSQQVGNLICRNLFFWDGLQLYLL